MSEEVHTGNFKIHLLFQLGLLCPGFRSLETPLLCPRQSRATDFIIIQPSLIPPGILAGSNSLVSLGDWELLHESESIFRRKLSVVSHAYEIDGHVVKLPVGDSILIKHDEGRELGQACGWLSWLIALVAEVCQLQSVAGFYKRLLKERRLLVCGPPER